MKSVFTKEYEQLLLLLITARKNKGLTQMYIAEKLGKPQSFVSKYERGERRLDVVEFVRVTQAIGIDATQVISSIKKDLAPSKKK